MLSIMQSCKQVLLFSAAMTADGTVWTWGSNTDCQLGRPVQQDSASDHSCPRAVAGPEAPLAGILSPAYHACHCFMLCLIW